MNGQPDGRTRRTHTSQSPKYGARQQYAPTGATAPQVSAEDKLFVQQVLGTFLYYTHAVDSTMLVALSAIVTEQSRPTETTMAKVK